MQIRYRRGKPNELSGAIRHLEPERLLYSPQVWNQLPELLEDLRSRERILICIAEDVDAGEVVFVGASAFVDPGFLQSALSAGQGLLDPALAAELSGLPAFLNHKQVADANRREDLRLINFLGVPIWADFNHADASTVLDNLAGDPILVGVIEAWWFFHNGFRIREIWLDSVVPLMIQVYQQRFGYQVQMERRLAGGACAKLLRHTREEAANSWPNSFFSAAMLSPAPVLGFTRAEQKLLELALLDCSDREAALELNLTPEAIKKRWRSIYAKISRTDPSLLRSGLAGADQRRAVLQYLRNNLQELRPY
jgi:hypothetical protein